MSNSSRRSPSGIFMALIGLCMLALVVLIIYGTAISNPDLVRQLIGGQSEATSGMGAEGGTGEFSEGTMPEDISDSGDTGDSGIVDYGVTDSSGIGTIETSPKEPMINNAVG